MATRAGVAYFENGLYRGIYVHNDGYPEWLGEVLRNHYNNIENIRKLVSYGDASYVTPVIGDKPNVSRDLKVCYFYHRDRGEPKHIFETKDYDKLVSFFRRCGCEYLYVYDDDWETWEVIEL